MPFALCTVLIIVEKPVSASAHPPSLPLSTASSISLMKMKIMKVFANFPNHCNLSVTRTRAESGRGQGCMASFLLISQLHQIHSPPSTLYTLIQGFTNNFLMTLPIHILYIFYTSSKDSEGSTSHLRK